MNLWNDINPGNNVLDIVSMIIEISKGSRNKYKYDNDKKAFILDRIFYSPVFYPAGHGFIPKSLYYDGDPMDILVLADQPTFSGYLVDVRPTGI